MNPALHLARAADPAPERSPLAAARLRRRLTIDEAARRAGLPPAAADWLEQGRVYRFPSTDDALAAAVLYGAALGIELDEARRLAGLPCPPRSVRSQGLRRTGILLAAAVAVGSLAAALALARERGEASPASGAGSASRARLLPPPWEISVDVLNGGGDIVYTRRIASRVGALAYTVRRVTKADRFDYPETAVFYEPGGAAIGARLSRALGVEARPLPGGKNPRRLVVIVGPPRLEAG